MLNAYSRLFMQHDVFISYAEENKQIANTICAELEKLGFHCWIAPRDITPGTSWAQSIVQAIDESRSMVLIFSSWANSSPHVLREAEQAVRISTPIVPFRVEDVEPSDELGYFIRTPHWLNAMTPPYEQYIFELADALKILLDSEVPCSEESKSYKKPKSTPESKSVFNSLFPQQNPYFTGREAILEDLHESLTANKKGAWKQAITGMGGVGKTQLAAEYAYQYRKKYAIIWWMRAEDPITLASDYAALADVIGAESLGLAQDQMADQPVKVQAIQCWLDNESDWLLIFDNAQKPEDILLYLPHQGGGHVLITSRIQNWNGVTESTRELGVFDRDEAAKFVVKRTGKSDKSATEALANELGRLPLALEQATAYINTRHISLDGYLIKFRAHHKALLKRGRPLNYPDTVATTWEISFQQAQHETRSAVDLLTLCAYLAPDNIPICLLFSSASPSAAEDKLFLTDELEFDDAFATLLNYSLITVTEDTISMHRLVQLIVQDRLSKKKAGKWIDVAVQLLNQAFSFNPNDPTTWPLCAALIPHVLQIWEHAKRLNLASPVYASLLSRAGLYLQAQANVGTARLLHEQALEIYKAVYGEKHPSVASSLLNFGNTLMDLGEYAQAEKNLEQALGIYKAVYGEKHPSVATCLNNLGIVSRDLGHYAQAKVYHLRALETRRTLFGTRHPEVAASLNNLGVVLKDLGDYAQAKKCHEQALRIYKNLYGSEHHDVATTLNNLGAIFSDLGNYSKAKEYFTKTLEVNKAIYGAQHPIVASSQGNLGLVLRDMGDYAQAKACLEEALAIFLATYGNTHPDVAASLNSLGSVFRAMGNLGEAGKYFEQALIIRRIFYGENHHLVAESLNNLGVVLKDLREYDQARQCYEKALQIDKFAFGTEHPSVATDLNNLGLVFRDLGDIARAEKCLKQALQIYRAIYGNRHSAVAKTLANLETLKKRKE